MVTDSTNPFDDPQHVDVFAKRAKQMIPTYDDIHRLAAVLMAERAADGGRVLVLGGGGGLETKAFAEAQPGWGFDVVDPAEAMLDLAGRTLGPLTSRVRMHQGYVDDAHAGPFDAATSLLTLHFLDADERRRTVAEVRKRLAPGAPFVAVHLSFPQGSDAERQCWIDRHIAYLVASGLEPADAVKAREAVANQVPALTPEQDRAILVDAGFRDVSEFFSAFTFRGWVGYA